jgi:Cu2+-exporting ATPase
MGRAEWVGATPRDHTATWVQIGDDILEFGFADQTRGGAVDLITDLQQAGIDVQILSGDGLAPVSRVAAALGVTAYYANQTPETKAAHIAQLQAQGRHVLMIGDGLNDTAALTSAHVSISPATALDAARVASDIVFLGQRLDSLIGIIALSQTAQRRIRENFQLASLYNVLAVPVAIAGFATPLIAALAMSLSSITVTLNALRMK